jgi:hypothetical protein
LVSIYAHNPWAVVTPTFEYQLINIQLFVTLTTEKHHVSLAASSRNQQCSCSGQKISIIDQLAPAIVLNAQWLSLKSLRCVRKLWVNRKHSTNLCYLAKLFLKGYRALHFLPVNWDHSHPSITGCRNNTQFILGSGEVVGSSIPQ